MTLFKLLESDEISDGLKAAIRSEMEKLSAENNRQKELFQLLIKASHNLDSSVNLDQVLAGLLDEVLNLMSVVGCSIWLLDHATGEMCCRLANGLGANIVLGWRLERGKGIAGWVFENGKSLIVGDASLDARHFEGVNEVTRLGVRSLLTLPLRTREETIGVLQIVDTAVGRFTLDDLEAMEPLAATAALAIENARLFGRLHQELQQRKQVEEELARAGRAKDKLFSIIAHDLKNPFTSILHISEIIRSSHAALSPERLATLSEELSGTTRRVNDLLDNLLLWSRSQLGNINYVPEEFPLGAMVEQTLELLRRGAVRKGIHLINNVPPDTRITTDPNLTGTIIRNLVTNAIKFTQRGGRIIADVRTTDSSNIISVIDNGIGIPPEKLESLFQPGYQPTPGTENEPGTGLGLLLCRDFAEKCGGSLVVESIPEKGSVFRLVLPR